MFIPVRYLVAILGCTAMAINYGLMMNLVVGLESMVNKTAFDTSIPNLNSSSGGCDLEDDADSESSSEDGPFDWSLDIQRWLFLHYFIWYIAANGSGGRVTNKQKSVKWVIFFSVAINAVCTLLNPLAANLHRYVLLALKGIQGLCGGFCSFPAMNVLLARWAPPLERGFMCTICYGGTALGTALSILLSSITANGVGWEAIFYIQGGVTCVWLVMWFFLIADTPDEARFISDEERDYINNELIDVHGEWEKEYKPPYRSIFTSSPFYAILVADVCSSFGWYLVVTNLVLFMKMVLHYKISEHAWLIALPFFCMWIFSLILSEILNELQAAEKISCTTAKKVATAIASVGPFCCFITLYFVICNRTMTVVFMTIAITLSGGMFCGFLSNHIEIAPNYAGTLIGITNAAATFLGTTCGLQILRFIIESKPSITTWKNIFMVTAVFYGIEAIYYTILGSAEVQTWNE